MSQQQRGHRALSWLRPEAPKARPRLRALGRAAAAVWVSGGWGVGWAGGHAGSTTPCDSGWGDTGVGAMAGLRPPPGPPQICFLSPGQRLLLLLPAAVGASHVSKLQEPLGAAGHPGTGRGLHQLPVPDVEPGRAPAVQLAPSRLHGLSPHAQRRSPQTGAVPISRTSEE